MIQFAEVFPDEKIVVSLIRQLVEKYGKGWVKKHFVIVSAVGRQLRWTHLKTILYLKGDLQREFYFDFLQIFIIPKASNQ